MLQFPQFRFYPTLQKGSDSSFGRSLRTSLVVGLAAFIFFAPLGFAVSARNVSVPRQLFSQAAPAIHVQDDQTEQQAKKEIGGVDSFIIEMVDGVSTCREATPEEVASTLPRPGDKGIPVKDLLQRVYQSQAASSGGDNSSTGLTINLLALQQLQSDANRDTVIAAFDRAAGVWTARIKSPVTISMKIEYGVNSAGGGAFPSGVLGSTSSGSVSNDYPGTRAKLITSSSGATESGIYNSLPTSVIPTDTGDGSVIAISRSLTQPLGFLAPEPDTVVATISFNKNFPFDFNPDNGIDFDKIDFVAVATHEIGHALGFTSNAGEGSTAQVALWDMFRLAPGTTSATFPTAQRIMTIGGSQVYFTGQTFVVEGVGTNELGLSTGGPDSSSGGDGRQSSHWKDDDLTGKYIGIMDPTISDGVSQAPTENDFSTLETLGWNLVDSTPPPSPPLPPSNDNFANAQIISGCSGSVNGTNLNSSKETEEPTHVPGGGSRSVWYQWQAPSTGSVTITTAGSGYDTTLAVYTGTSVNALNSCGPGEVCSNDDIPDVPGQPHDVSSSVTFPANGGTIYRIAVDGFNNGGSGGDMGPIKLNWNQSNCTAPTQYSVAGQVLDNQNNPVSGVLITFEMDFQGTPSTQTTQTDSSGNYSSADLGCKNRVSVRPSKTDYSFSPLSMTFVSTQCLTGSGTANFTATRDWEPVVITANQAEIKTWTFQGRTYAYVKLTFPDAGYRVTDWGSVVASGTDFSVNALVERFKGVSAQAIKTTAQIYDLGPVAPGNYSFTFKNSGTVVKSQAFSVSSTPPPANPIDNQREFVRQQYRDFLNREADIPGENFWTDNITKCLDPARRPPSQTEAQCIARQRETTSAAFFVSPEFQNTGYFVLRVYKGSFDRMPYFGGTGDNAKDEFTRDHATVSTGIVVNDQLDAARINSNKQAFVNQFVTRPDFLAIYGNLSNQEYVDKLIENTDVQSTPELQLERQQLINGLNASTPTETRASVLFKIVDGTNTIANGALEFNSKYGKAFYDLLYNPGFVQMEYFGYMRRDPDDAGFAFWLAKMNQFGNFVDAEMVLAFILSPEYRSRFGQP